MEGVSFNKRFDTNCWRHLLSLNLLLRYTSYSTSESKKFSYLRQGFRNIEEKEQRKIKITNIDRLIFLSKYILFSCQRWPISRSFLFYAPKLEHVLHSFFLFHSEQSCRMERSSFIAFSFPITPGYMKTPLTKFPNSTPPGLRPIFIYCFKGNSCWNLS